MSSAAEARGQANALPTDPTAAVPREYNFAADIIERNLKAGRAGRPAFIDPRGSWTYGQLADRVARFASALRALGVQREERILICLADTIDWPTAFLGALKAGVVAVPVNTLMTEDDYRFMLADSRARISVCCRATRRARRAASTRAATSWAIRGRSRQRRARSSGAAGRCRTSARCPATARAARTGSTRPVRSSAGPARRTARARVRSCGRAVR